MRLIKKTHTVSDAGLLPQTWSTNINSGNKNFQCTLKIYMNQALHCPQCPRPHWTNKIQHPAPELGQITGYLRTELLNRKLVHILFTCIHTSIISHFHIHGTRINQTMLTFIISAHHGLMGFGPSQQRWRSSKTLSALLRLCWHPLLI